MQRAIALVGAAAACAALLALRARRRKQQALVLGTGSAFARHHTTDAMFEAFFRQRTACGDRAMSRAPTRRPSADQLTGLEGIPMGGTPAQQLGTTLDPSVAAMIAKLNAEKLAAVNAEDFDEAKRLKERVDDLKKGVPEALMEERDAKLADGDFSKRVFKACGFHAHSVALPDKDLFRNMPREEYLEHRRGCLLRLAELAAERALAS
jgi:hypothetical protein